MNGDEATQRTGYPAIGHCQLAYCDHRYCGGHLGYLRVTGSKTVSWNYDQWLMCDRCGQMPFIKIKPAPSRAKQLAMARAGGWLLGGELHYCAECQK